MEHHRSDSFYIFFFYWQPLRYSDNSGIIEKGKVQSQTYGTETSDNRLYRF